MLTTIALSVIISLVITLSISYLIIRMFQNVVVSMEKNLGVTRSGRQIKEWII